MKRICFCVLVLFSIAGSVQAVFLPPGGGASPVLVQPPPSPVPIAVMVSPYNVGGTLVGTVTSWVVAGDPLNPFGGLSFYYQVVNTGTDYVSRFTATSFAPVPAMPVDVTTINAPWDGALAGGVAPFYADRSIAGDVVGFVYPAFIGQILSGQWSEVMVVHTPAFASTTGLGAVIDGRAANVDVLVPIPEPATIGLLGLGALSLLRKRKA